MLCPPVHLPFVHSNVPHIAQHRWWRSLMLKKIISQRILFSLDDFCPSDVVWPQKPLKVTMVVLFIHNPKHDLMKISCFIYHYGNFLILFHHSSKSFWTVIIVVLHCNHYFQFRDIFYLVTFVSFSFRVLFSNFSPNLLFSYHSISPLTFSFALHLSNSLMGC